jgi:integrase
VRDNVATLRTEKSQGEMIVSIPILPILQQTLEAGPTGELAFICGKNGKPLTKESFGNAFKDACRAAGLFNRSAHGCRKIAATRAAEAGATVAELNAIFGWKGTSMASLRGCRSQNSMQWRRCRARRTKLQHLYPHLVVR